MTVIKPSTVQQAPEASGGANGGGSSGRGHDESQNDFIARLGWQTFVSGELVQCADAAKRMRRRVASP